jgi:integrase
VASIQRRRTKSGDSWRVQYRVDGALTSTTLFDHDAAIEFAALVDRIGGKAARAVLLAREAAPAGMQTFAAYAAAYVARIDGITDGTRKDYAGMVARRLAGTPLGELPLVAVDRDSIVAWTRTLDVATKTRRNYHALLSTVLAAAVDDGLIPSNPARGIHIKQAEPASTMVFLSPGEAAVLVSAIDPRYRALVVLLLATGMRWGEATALQVGDVDLDGAVPLLRVRQAWKRTGSGAMELGPPKTRAGNRTVSLAPEVAATLRPLLEGRPHDAFVFTGSTGKPLRQSNFHRNVWTPAVRRLNESGALTKRPRIHDLRHTHASAQVAAGVPLNVIQRRLGHESITTTVDRYSHLAPDYLAVSAAASSAWLVNVVPELEG